MKLERPFSLLPVKVLPHSSAWEVNHEFDTVDLLCILYAEPNEGDLFLPFSICYALRWHEMARKDSKGKYWLMNGKSIRTPLHLWCIPRKIHPVFTREEICFPDEIRSIF